MKNPRSPSNRNKRFSIDLDEQSQAPEMRQDYLHDQYVIIAPSRHYRPYDSIKIRKPKLIETTHSPRLEKNEQVWKLLDKNGTWQTMVVLNKYPSLTLQNPRAYGRQEIVIDTPLAATAFAELSASQIKNVLSTYVARTRELLKIKDINYVLIFRNDGLNAGASLAHAHSQIFGLPVVPAKFAREELLASNFAKQSTKSVYDSIVEFETSARVRVVNDTKHFLVFCPFASRWPYELWLLPKRHFTNIAELTEQELSELSQLIKRFTGKLTRQNIDYNMYLQNGGGKFTRFCVKICGRTNTWGGFEVATDMIINTVSPEMAANWYKK